MELSLLIYLLLLRLKSAVRFLKELGYVRLVLLAALLAGFAETFAALKDSFTGAVVITAFPVSIIFSFHSLRKDERFLSTFTKGYRRFYFVEYLLIALLFIILLLFSPFFYFTVFIVLFCIAATFLRTDIKTSSYVFNVNLRLPLYSFEWMAGLRRYWLFFAVIYILAAVFSYETGAAPLALTLIAFTIPSFYVTGEPRVMLQVFAVPPGKFLRLKMFNALSLFTIGTLPLVILFIFFNYDKWYLISGVYIICAVIIISCVLTKYAFYIENNMVTYLNMLITGIIIFSIISAFYLTGPFLFLLPFFMLAYLYRKAAANLKFYLNAYN